MLLLSGSGLITKSNLEIEENSTNKTIPKVVGVGDLVGALSINTSAEGMNSLYNNLDSSISGVGYAGLYVQYAPDTSYENITFIPTFSLCERLRLSTNSSGSLIGYSADVLGFANGVEYLIFDTIPLDDVAIDETFDLDYHPVNISGEVYDEDWSVKPVQYEDTLVLLRGTGKIKLNFTFSDRNTAHPEITGYGYLSGDVTKNILPHYMNVIAIGTDVATMDESGQGGFGITFAPGIPDVEIPDVEIPDE